jgi:hypothetical protein
VETERRPSQDRHRAVAAGAAALLVGLAVLALTIVMGNDGTTPFEPGPVQFSGWLVALLGVVAFVLGVVALVIGSHGSGPAREFDGAPLRLAASSFVVLAGSAVVALGFVVVQSGWESTPGRPRRRGCLRRREVDRAASSTEPWARAARHEAMSVSAFRDLAAELTVLGAPDELIASTIDAARDEVRHAFLCADLASAPEVEDELVEIVTRPARACSQPAGAEGRAVRLVRLALESYADGVINEGRSAQRLLEHAERGGPDASTLARIAGDEQRHVALAWSIIGWALDEGGEPVRRAVRLQARTARRRGALALALARSADQIGEAGSARLLASASPG